MKDEDQTLESGDLQIDTLAGDLRDAMLTRIRHLQKPWPQMSEAEQRDCAEGIGLASRELVRETVSLLNAHEWPTCAVTLGEVKIKGAKGIEVKVTASNVEHNRNVLGDHVDDMVMIVMTDAETFMGERAPVRIDPDQPELSERDDDPDTSDVNRPPTEEELIARATEIVRSEGSASTSMLQRALVIGYNRAARIMEALEERGVVSAPDAKGKRTVILLSLPGGDGDEDAAA